MTETAGWQPIDTAPKDAARILLLFPEPIGTAIGRWDDEKYHKKPQPHWACIPQSYWGVRNIRDNQLTHWMPLPERPAT